MIYHDISYPIHIVLLHRITKSLGIRSGGDEPGDLHLQFLLSVETSRSSWWRRWTRRRHAVICALWPQADFHNNSFCSVFLLTRVFVRRLWGLLKLVCVSECSRSAPALQMMLYKWAVLHADEEPTLTEMNVIRSEPFKFQEFVPTLRVFCAKSPLRTGS